MTPAEKLMRKYGYGYIHANKLLNERYVHDLLLQLKCTKQTLGNCKQAYNQVVKKSARLYKKIQSLKQEIKYIEKNYVLIKKEELNRLNDSLKKKNILKK